VQSGATELKRLSVSCEAGPAAIERNAAAIDQLNAMASRSNPFMSAAFLQNFCQRSEYSSPGDGERLYLVREGANLIGIVPICRVDDGAKIPLARALGWRSIRLCLMAPQDTELPGVLAAPIDQHRVAEALLSYLCSQEQGWDLLDLVGQQPDSALRIAALAAAGHSFLVRESAVQPYNDVTLVWPDLPQYFRSLSKKMRSNISRQARRLFAAGNVELVLADGAVATSAWFDAYCELDGRSWKHGTHASIRRHPRRVDFYRAIAGGNAGMDPAFIGILLDGVLVAGLMTGSSPRQSGSEPGTWCLEMAYDQSHADLGPAQLLLLLAVGHAIESNRSHLSFMQNFSYFKHRWGAQPIEVSNVALVRRNSLRHLLAALRDRFHALRKHRHGDLQRDESDETGDSAAPARATLDERAQARARALVAASLAKGGIGVRILDREEASSYLPFPVD
jgi:hypothetical protein